MAEKIKKSIPWVLFVVLIGLIIGVGFCSFWFPRPQGAKATTTTSTITPQVTVGNATPSVSAVDLGSAITLTGNTTTNATCSATITDTNGDSNISGATSTIYRTGATRDCTDSDNDCYRTTTCTLAAADGNNDRNATCTITLQFHADPTDNGSYATAQGWNAQTWQCHLTAIDASGATASNTDQTSPPDINTTAAVITGSAIDYGTLAPGATSSAPSSITASTTGNTRINAKILGQDMRDFGASAYIFAGSEQEYATATTWVYGSTTATNISTSTFAELDLDSEKPTQHEPVQSGATDVIYWEIQIPGGQSPATYYSTTTIAAVED